ncbi:urea ABC transporter ATP-binding subunit UrtE [Peribacillus asahii]|uniref:Urea ABC transporter ATP-binding subunit UrtE n=1 Tax=Peribacillus asahii TaxID=228899 RepID=A0A398BF03_9BACI|nr:urea ABC transporter ATP-binding subunit UrtE [Peribacillus asahii]RID86133.1 urea ABC transporter ATP-binding subunit UrtE [Peribacillus asahii]
MLTARGLRAGYDESMVLHDVDFCIEPGKVTGILGRNGVGKSTFLKSIIGLVPLRNGCLSWEGENITKRKPDKRARLGIGYVPQGREIFSSLTVEENLLLGLEVLKGKKRKQSIPKEIFEWFPVLKEMLHRKGGDLSGGQQQQLAIARAMIGNPKILLLDEPMEGIQPSIVQLIQEVIGIIAKEKGIGVVLVEHNVDLALECSDYIYVMDRGTMVAEGKVSEVKFEDIEQFLVV